MEYIHIRSLEKFHPGYKDRELKWAKIYFGMVQGDPDCELIENEIDWGRLVKMILLELEAKRPLPNIDRYWEKKGFDIKTRPMSLTIQMLHNFVEVVTQLSKECVLDKEVEVDKEVEKSYVTTVFNSWNERMPWQINTITKSRLKHLRERLKEKQFIDNFHTILTKILESDFLSGRKPSKDHPNFRADFDWIIKNETNYIKVLEDKYAKREVAL